MRILLDECVHAGVRAAFPGHATKTVTDAGWRGSKDGPRDNFDVFVTIDRTLEHEHQLSRFRLGFVVVRVPDNTFAAYKPLFE